MKASKLQCVKIFNIQQNKWLKSELCGVLPLERFPFTYVPFVYVILRKPFP